ncbi:hypothetical protein SALBM217S_09401 [Streptomyces griseoloalbus]
MLRMTSSMSKARPVTSAPCATSTSSITTAVRTRIRRKPRVRGATTGASTPKGTPSRMLPPICLTASRRAGWSR